jgi:hypothetical protein
MKNYLVLLLTFSCGLWAAAPGLGATGTRETVGPMTVPIPAGWTRQARPDGTVVFLAGAAGSQELSEIQFSSVDAANADQGTVHTALWNEMLKQLAAPSSQVSGEFGRFNWSEMEALDRAENRRFWYRLFNSKEGASHVVVMIAAGDARTFRNRIAAVEDALSQASFAGARQAATATAPVSAPAMEGTPIVESQIHVQIRPISFGSNMTSDHILFFQNGIAVRTGFTNGPRECYAALPATNLQSLPFNYGRWRENAATRALDVAWQEGPSWHLTREGSQLSLEGKKLLKFRPIDGAQFDGVYAYRPVGGEPSALRLTAGGKFEARNLTDSMVCPIGQSAMRDGSGSYEVKKWTLILRFDNGVTNLLPLGIPDGEGQQGVTRFLVNGYDFSLVR